MNWFKRKTDVPHKPNYWDQLEANYPKGSEWIYLGKRVVLMRTYTWDLEGFQNFEPCVQYLDHNGNIRTSYVCLQALKPIGVEKWAESRSSKTLDVQTFERFT